jgi:hypothetical protein
MSPAGVGNVMSDGIPTILTSEMAISESPCPCREIRKNGKRSVGGGKSNGS